MKWTSTHPVPILLDRSTFSALGFGHFLLSYPVLLWYSTDDRSDTMNTKRFTQEEQEALRANPYTYKVTSAQLRFTAEFKAYFWDEYNKGILPKEILKSCGYEPAMLGDSRINGILLHIRETVKNGEEFRSESKPRTPKDPSKGENAVTLEDELKQLKSEVKYLRKEVDFLKKISSVKTSKRQVKS